MKALPKSRGFTLVEILTVIVIIGILVGLLLPAMNSVRGTVKVWRMKSEMTQIQQALEQVRTTLGGGDYPPDGSSTADALQFFRRAFPRATYTYTVSSGVIQITPPGGAAFPLQLRPETALSFWLGGLRDINGNFVGFSSNPADPLNISIPYDSSSTSTTGGRVGPFFDFDMTRVCQVSGSGDSLDNTQGSANGWNAPGGGGGATQGAFVAGTVLFPQNDQSLGIPAWNSAGAATNYAPYLYFKAVGGKYSDTATQPPGPNGNENYHIWTQPASCAVPGGAGAATVITPVKDSRNVIGTGASAYFGWINPKSFQLLCPGLDGAFDASSTGTGPNSVSEAKSANGYYAPIYPDGMNYSGGTMDDITNFSNGKLQSDMP